MRTSRTLLLVLVALTLGAVGCGGDDVGDATGDAEPPPTDGATGDAGPIDGQWRLVSGSVDGDDIGVIDGWDVTMDLDGDDIGGTAACNGYGGTVVVVDESEGSGSFSVGELSWTEMGCEPAVMTLEQQFLAAISDVDSFELTDQLVLTGTDGDTALIFEPVAPVEDRAVVGTTWRLDTVISGDAASNSSAMDAAFLVFHDDGTLEGSTGCRRLEGEWALRGATIEIPVLSAIDDPTAGVCAPASEALDGQFVAVVESGSTVEVDGERLTLTAPGGDGLSFVADDRASSD